MKAVLCNRYIPIKKVMLKETDMPSPGDNDVLVKVHATCVNYNSLIQTTGQPLLTRLMGFGLITPKYKIPGSDIAGRVEAVGANVKQFKPGDAVFGELGEYGYSAFAEYACAAEDAFVLKPANLSFEEAAAVPQAGLVALQAVRDNGEIRSGQHVLINGASGGIGTFAVQIAKALGAQVTGICSTKNIEMVRSIGADHVIDYTQEDFTQSGQLYDLIVATAGYRSIYDYEKSLKPNGIYVATGGRMQGPKAFAQIFEAIVKGPRLSNNKKLGMLTAKIERKNLVFLANLIEENKIKPVVDRQYPFHHIADALMYYQKGHAKGKVIITMEV